MKTSMLKPAALLAAMAAVSLPAMAAETACVAAGGTNCPAQIPDAPQAALTSTMTVPALSCPNGAPTGVAVRLNITHDWTGDLNITLTNPNATTATIVTANPLTNDGSDLIATYSGFPTLLGASTGAWTLTVLDTANGNDGALNNWSVDAVCPVTVPTMSASPMAGMALLLALLGMFSLRRHLRR